MATPLPTALDYDQSRRRAESLVSDSNPRYRDRGEGVVEALLMLAMRPPKLTGVRPSSRQLKSRQRGWRAEVTDRLPELLAELLAGDDCASSAPRSHGIYLFSDERNADVRRPHRQDRALDSARRAAGYSNFRTRRAAHTHAQPQRGHVRLPSGARISFIEAGRRTGPRPAPPTVGTRLHGALPRAVHAREGDGVPGCRDQPRPARGCLRDLRASVLKTTNSGLRPSRHLSSDGSGRGITWAAPKPWRLSAIRRRSAA